MAREATITVQNILDTAFAMIREKGCANVTGERWLQKQDALLSRFFVSIKMICIKIWKN